MSHKIISKYIKDISFEIPDAKSFVMLEKEISNYKLNFDIKSNPFKENIIEVSTILRMTPNEDVKNKKLTQSSLIENVVSIESQNAKTILIIDDDPTVSELIKRQLTKDAYNVFVNSKLDCLLLNKYLIIKK